MEVVLPNGTVIDTLPVPRHASSPDLNQLFIGSEGTLGVMTKVTMIIHRIPEERRFHAFVFKDLHAAMDMTSRLRPCRTRRRHALPLLSLMISTIP